MKKFAVHQPNYLPWWGYFSKIAEVDYFVFLDHVVFPRGKSFTSRVMIRQENFSKWLTIPVQKSNGSPISDVVFRDDGWRRKHKKSLYLNYKKTKYNGLWMDFVQDALDTPTESLADLNIFLIEGLSKVCGLKTKFFRSSALQLPGAFNSESIACIADMLEATSYVSGRGLGSAKTVNCDYLRCRGVNVVWLDEKMAVESLGGEVFEPEKKLTFLDTLSFNGIRI